ncbi:unnamed protein product [Malus baccata var. baccata]|uniref:Uncharacterized protein n=1 Tax=Malus domestica TaxID=3750 RepID=A0A498J6A0_MALDO|nr:hypothetical protein DVH24_031729 [Malus domestica]
MGRVGAREGVGGEGGFCPLTLVAEREKDGEKYGGGVEGNGYREKEKWNCSLPLLGNHVCPLSLKFFHQGSKVMPFCLKYHFVK